MNEKDKEQQQPVDEQKNAAPEAEEEVKETAAKPEEKKAKKKDKKAAKKTYTVTEEDMQKMEGLAAQMAALNDQHLRVVAEYDNYRKRTQKEKENIYQDAKIETISKFLDIYDNLALAVAQEGDEDNVHKKGMEMIFHKLEDVLTKMGVTIEDPAGKPFDPERHNAVMHIDDENLGENTVAQVFQKGFLLGDKVIRFATVQVAN